MGLRYHTTGTEDLRHLATARLVLDNFPHIKAYWIMITPKLAQVALSFGANDVDGTVVEETIYHMAGANTDQQMTRYELERIIREAGFEPVERDTLYNPIERTSAGVTSSNPDPSNPDPSNPDHSVAATT
jgi:aminodeoxyfutalosine synthase